MKSYFSALYLILFCVFFLFILSRAKAAPYYATEAKDPKNLYEISGVYYYTANHFKYCSYSYEGQCITYSFGFQLWRSDGTSKGTQMLQAYAFDTSIEEGYPLFSDAFMVAGKSLYFIGQRSYSSFDLSRIDNSLSEPQVVKTFYQLSNPGMDHAFNYHFTAYNDLLIFTANDDYGSQGDQYGTELWRTDGTEAGTMMIKDIYQGIESANPEEVSVSNGLLYFNARDQAGIDGWQSDGTREGTIKVNEQIRKTLPLHIATYPNPFEGLLTVEIKGLAGKINLLLTDFKGMPYFEQGYILSKENPHLSLDLSSVIEKKGIYLIIITAEDGKKLCKRIIKR